MCWTIAAPLAHLFLLWIPPSFHFPFFSSFRPSLQTELSCVVILHLACQPWWHMDPFIRPSPLCWETFPDQAGTSSALCCPLKNFLPNKASKHSTGWIFLKNSSLEKNHSKPGQNLICMACFQRDSVLSGVKRLLSLGVSCRVRSTWRHQAERWSSVCLSGSEVDGRGSDKSLPIWPRILWGYLVSCSQSPGA